MPTPIAESVRKNAAKALFAEEYRNLQSRVTKLSGTPLPPCYFCGQEQLWTCFQSGHECTSFKAYCLLNE